jgi:AmmeMemoRadiSam system protein B
VGRVLEALAEWRTRLGPDVLVVAGVDLSHVGPKFGHNLQASDLLPEAERHDRALLDALGRMDAVAFWEEAARVDDRFNVCGFSSMAFLLEILPRGRGWLLDYDIWREEPTRSAVSFAGLAFTKT